MDKDTKRNKLIAEIIKVNEQIENMQYMDWRRVLEGDLIMLSIELTELLND